MKPLVFKKAKRMRHQPPVRMRLHITKGDTVQVISGEDKGKQGRVLQVHPKTGRITIEGINMVKRHRRATQTPKVASWRFAAPIHHSKAMLIDPKSGEPTRVRRRGTPMEQSSGSRSSRTSRSRGTGKWRRARRRRPEGGEGGRAARGNRRPSQQSRAREGQNSGNRGRSYAQGGRGDAAAAGVLREDGTAAAGQRVRAWATRTRCPGWSRSSSTWAWATRAKIPSSWKPRWKSSG